MSSFGKKHEILSKDFVAVDGDRPKGAIILKRCTLFTGEVTGFYVRSDYQCHRIVRILLNRALTAAIEAGYKEILLTTNKNLTAAINLYESFDCLRQSEKPGNGADYLCSLNLRQSV